MGTSPSEPGTYIGFGISTYPYVVPHEVDIWDAAAPDSSLKFLLVGTVVLLPMIIAYTAHSYWVFRGKIDDGKGYEG
ncbi:MAG: cytochrome d ubiquinol oxidase subunit II [Pseudomonadales bacterium]